MIKNVMSSSDQLCLNLKKKSQSFEILFLYVSMHEIGRWLHENMYWFDRWFDNCFSYHTDCWWTEGFRTGYVSFEDGHCPGHLVWANKQTVLYVRHIEENISLSLYIYYMKIQNSSSVLCKTYWRKSITIYLWSMGKLWHFIWQNWKSCAQWNSAEKNCDKMAYPTC